MWVNYRPILSISAYLLTNGRTTHGVDTSFETWQEVLQGLRFKILNVRWYSEGANFVGCSWDIFGLPAGETVDMVCSYQGYPRAGTFNWGVSVAADHEITESDERINEQSGDIVINPVVVQEPPSEPTNCSVSSTGQTSVVITWASFDDASREGFRIYQGTTSLETTVGPDEVMVTIGNLAPSTQYHFDVRAFNGAGESPVDAWSVYPVTNP